MVTIKEDIRNVSINNQSIINKKRVPKKPTMVTIEVKGVTEETEKIEEEEEAEVVLGDVVMKVSEEVEAIPTLAMILIPLASFQIIRVLTLIIPTNHMEEEVTNKIEDGATISRTKTTHIQIRVDSEHLRFSTNQHRRLISGRSLTKGKSPRSLHQRRVRSLTLQQLQLPRNKEATVLRCLRKMRQSEIIKLS
jgi:hypothetical protein